MKKSIVTLVCFVLMVPNLFGTEYEPVQKSTVLSAINLSQEMEFPTMSREYRWPGIPLFQIGPGQRDSTFKKSIGWNFFSLALIGELELYYQQPIRQNQQIMILASTRISEDVVGIDWDNNWGNGEDQVQVFKVGVGYKFYNPRMSWDRLSLYIGPITQFRYHSTKSQYYSQDSYLNNLAPSPNWENSMARFRYRRIDAGLMMGFDTHWGKRFILDAYVMLGMAYNVVEARHNEYYMHQSDQETYRVFTDMPMDPYRAESGLSPAGKLAVQVAYRFN